MLVPPSPLSVFSYRYILITIYVSVISDKRFIYIRERACIQYSNVYIIRTVCLLQVNTVPTSSWSGMTSQTSVSRGVPFEILRSGAVDPHGHGHRSTLYNVKRDVSACWCMKRVQYMCILLPPAREDLTTRWLSFWLVLIHCVCLMSLLSNTRGSVGHYLVVIHYYLF